MTFQPVLMKMRKADAGNDHGRQGEEGLWMVQGPTKESLNELEYAQSQIDGD